MHQCTALQAGAWWVVVVVVKRVLPLDADRPGPGVAAAVVAQVEVALCRGKEGDAVAEALAGLQRRDPGLQAALKAQIGHTVGLQAPTNQHPTRVGPSKSTSQGAGGVLWRAHTRDMVQNMSQLPYHRLERVVAGVQDRA